MSERVNVDMDDKDDDVVPKSVSDVLTEVSLIHGISMKSSMLDFHISLLEDELKKIDAFKRELPYCMQLLQDAIERLKDERLRLGGRGGVAEASNTKKTWMSMTLWNAPLHFQNHTSSFKSKALANEEKSVAVEEVSTLSIPVEAIDLSVKHEHQKKQRRCWSPQLHKLFVDALLQLGGPHVATPKQIRELMKVEGLTNDEVKSHLQKYRLHVRKLPAASEVDKSDNPAST